MTPPAQSGRDAELSYTRKVLIAVSITATAFVLLIFIWYALWVLLLMFAGVLLAVLLAGVADAIDRVTKMGYRPSLAIGVVLLLGLLVIIGYYAIPAIAKQTNELWEQIPVAVDSVREFLSQYAWGRWLISEDGPLAGTGNLVSRASGALYTAAGGIFALVIVLFTGIYLAISPSLYTNAILRMLPMENRPRGQEILGALGYTLRWWLVGQLTTMSAVGIMVAVGLWLLGIPLAFILGVLAFLLDFVPNFGPIAAAIPGVLLGLLISPTTALYVVGLYFVVQQIEGLVLSPLVHQRTVHLPPVLTVSAQVLLGILGGPLGLLLATPLVAVAMVLVKMLYVEQTLGDDVDTPADHLEEKDKPPLPEPKNGDKAPRPPDTRPDVEPPAKED